MLNNQINKIKIDDDGWKVLLKFVFTAIGSEINHTMNSNPMIWFDVKQIAYKCINI